MGHARRLCILTHFCLGFTLAQSPDPILVKTYNKHGIDLAPLKMVEMNNGNLVIAGRGQTFRDTTAWPYWNPHEFILIGTGPNGDVNWYKNFSDTLITSLADMRVNTQGEVVLVGSGNNMDLKFIKLNAQGELNRVYSPPEVPSLMGWNSTVVDDGIMVFFYTEPDTSLPQIRNLMRFNETGQLLWHKILPEELFSPFRGVERLSNGNFILLGNDAFLERSYITAYVVDTNGDSVAHRRINSEFQPTDLVADENGGWAAVGTRDSRQYVYGGVELGLLKVDDTLGTEYFIGQTLFIPGENQGNVLNNDWYGKTIERTLDGGYIITGRASVKSTSRGTGSKIGANGFIDWTHAHITRVSQNNPHGLHTRDSAYTFIQQENDSLWRTGNFNFWFHSIKLIKFQNEHQASPTRDLISPDFSGFKLLPVLQGQPFISFSEHFTGQVKIFSPKGKLQAIYTPKNVRILNWNPHSIRGPLNSGVYLVQVSGSSAVAVKKILVP